MVNIPPIQGGAPQLCLLVYKPHEYYSYLRMINPSYCSYVHQLSYAMGHHLVYGDSGWFVLASWDDQIYQAENVVPNERFKRLLVMAKPWIPQKNSTESHGFHGKNHVDMDNLDFQRNPHGFYKDSASGLFLTKPWGYQNTIPSVQKIRSNSTTKWYL